MSERRAFGHKRLHVLMRRDGWVVNHKKTHRLYKIEHLQRKPKRPRRRRAVLQRTGAVLVTQPNQRWAMDCMHDTLAGGHVIRGFTVVDVCPRECVALVAARQCRGTDVARHLHAAGEAQGGLPAVGQCDNGSELTSTAFDQWASWTRVHVDFSRPGKPVDHCVCEAFNGSVRRAGLSHHWVATLAEAQLVLDTWRQADNNHRPHTTLGLQPPAVYRRAGIYEPRSVRALNSRFHPDLFWGTTPAPAVPPGARLSYGVHPPWPVMPRPLDGRDDARCDQLLSARPTVS